MDCECVFIRLFYTVFGVVPVKSGSSVLLNSTYSSPDGSIIASASSNNPSFPARFRPCHTPFTTEVLCRSPSPKHRGKEKKKKSCSSPP